MKPEVLLELLETTADQLGVRVSYEPLQNSVVHGGLCRVKREYRIIVDKRASSEERVITVASALAAIPSVDFSELELAPQVRDLLQTYRRSTHDAGGKPRGKAA